MFSGALQSELLQLTHLFSPPWSPCLPSHLEGVLLCVSRGLLQCQEQNPSFLELQLHRCSDSCWDLLGLSLWSWGQFCGHHPGVAGAPLFRVPKDHLTRQLGLPQHCWSEGSCLCFLLNSLFLVKGMSQSYVLPTPGFPSPVCVNCVFAPM